MFSQFAFTNTEINPAIKELQNAKIPSMLTTHCSEADKNQGYKRTNETNMLIDKHFNHLVEYYPDIFRNYQFKGDEEYIFEVTNLQIYTEILLDSKVESMKNGNKPITVLDIGAGSFAFNHYNDKKYKGKVETWGITATNNPYPECAAQSPDDHHVFANAEHLCKVFKENQFDYIFSAKTFTHFIDPIGSAIEAYKTLKPGGVLFIDWFIVPGCEDMTSQIISYLQEQGYSVVAGYCHQKIAGLVIQKTNVKPELIFPLEFKEIVKVNRQDKAAYSPNTALKIFCTQNNLTENALNNLRIQKVRSQLEKMNIPFYCNPYTNLFDYAPDNYLEAAKNTTPLDDIKDWLKEIDVKFSKKKNDYKPNRFQEMIGIENTFEWQDKATELRKTAWIELIVKLRNHNDNEKIEIINCAKNLKIFKEHRSNYTPTKNTDHTRAVNVLNQMQQELKGERNPDVIYKCNLVAGQSGSVTNHGFK